MNNKKYIEYNKNMNNIIYINKYINNIYRYIMIQKNKIKINKNNLTIIQEYNYNNIIMMYI